MMGQANTADGGETHIGLPHPAPMIGDCKRTSLPSGKPSKGREAKRANALIAGIGRGIEKRDHREIAFR